MIAWFKAETPGERYRLTKAEDLWQAVWEFDQWLRREIRHRDNLWLQPVRDQLHEELRDRGCDLDESGRE